MKIECVRQRLTTFTITTLLLITVAQGFKKAAQEKTKTHTEEEADFATTTHTADDELRLVVDFEQVARNFDNANRHQYLKSDNFSVADSKGRHSCERRCQNNQALTCYYRLVVHHYQASSAECERCFNNEAACPKQQCIYGDGVYTPIIAINQMLPAPPIEVCVEDTVVVDVINYLTEPISIHWHGLPMLRTPEMDGAPFVTQYPIQPAEGYRYQFNAERAGSVWYNSHVGLQRNLGVGGAFIIRQPVQSDPQSYLYDFDLPEHTLLIQDYIYGNDMSRVRNLLINSKGRNHASSISDRDPRHRYERLQVANGKRHRFRVVYNSVFNCPVEFSIENHRMLMISTDGNDIVPVLADSFFMTAGERFDFVLQANQQARSYWIRVRGYENCAKDNIYQGAILTYQSVVGRAVPQNPMVQTSFCDNDDGEYLTVGDYEQRLKKTVSFEKSECARADFKATNVATVGLSALEQVPWNRDTEFLTYYSLFGSRATAGAADLSYQIDDITFKMSKISLLQTNGLYNEKGVYCNRSMLAARGLNCETQQCICTNVVRLPAYRAIEIVLVNNNNEPTPVHLHGYTVRLVGQNVLGGIVNEKQVRDLDRRGQLQRSTDEYAIQKDTVQVPPLGYAIIRFYSSNPGYWMYHSSLDSQAVRGMIGVFKVGEDHQIKEVPPRLRC
ncbi:PREDICTED: laccase-12 [Bactrocera latifrons]|uniref:laccase-12 n=1 Tax=Bactrocera latifrons TaxID=174628 RepID=UPI0008DDE930|nr:PREDICTED: laccase-12 [Bactrocera latifrons]